MLPFERIQVAAGDLGGLRNFIQGDASHLPFAPKPITKSTHSSSIAFCWLVSQLAHILESKNSPYVTKYPLTVDSTTTFRVRKGYYSKVSGLLSGCRFP